MIIFSWILIILGFSLRVVSKFYLRNNFSWRVRIPKEFIDYGIYKYIRHPMYTGGLFLYTGLVLLSSKNILLTIVIFSLIINFILDRIDREEYAMIYKFGDIYKEYISKTKALIPFIA